MAPPPTRSSLRPLVYPACRPAQQTLRRLDAGVQPSQSEWHMLAGSSAGAGLPGLPVPLGGRLGFLDDRRQLRGAVLALMEVSK